MSFWTEKSKVKTGKKRERGGTLPIGNGSLRKRATQQSEGDNQNSRDLKKKVLAESWGTTKNLGRGGRDPTAGTNEPGRTDADLKRLCALVLRLY